MPNQIYPPGGALFRNDRKVAGSKQPDINGNLEISRELLNALNALDKSGQPIRMRIAGWTRVKDGKKWTSITASENQQKAPPPPTRPVPALDGLDDLDDDIPF